MLLWKQPVTDRSESDIKRVFELLKKGWQNLSENEKNEWNNGVKGSLNTSDLERVQNNIQLLSDVLELGLNVSLVPEVPTSSFYDEIWQHTEQIRGAYMIHSTTPEVPEKPLNTFEKWNDIEQILSDVYGILLNNFNYYCGNEIYAGEETGLLL